MTKALRYQIILKLIYSLVLVLFVIKPVYHYVSHFNDDENIELCEDSTESPLEEEDCCDTDDFFCMTSYNFTVNDVTSIIKTSKKRYMRQIIEVYTDVLIPPPKFL